jgi:hypothetical protein
MKMKTPIWPDTAALIDQHYLTVNSIPMKSWIGLTGLLTLALISCQNKSQQIEVPEVVQASFTALYPQAMGKIDWEMDDTLYEGSFKEANMEKAACFSSDGTLMYTESTYDPASLSQPILSYVSQQLGNQPVDEASIIRYADGSTGYEIEVGKKDYLFDSSGAFVKMEEAEAKKDD